MNEPTDWLWSALPEPIKAAMLAAIIAVLRCLGDADEPRWVRTLLEGALCGAIAVGVAHLTVALGMTNGWSIFFSALVGLFGAQEVRSIGRRIAKERLR